MLLMKKPQKTHLLLRFDVSEYCDFLDVFNYLRVIYAHARVSEYCDFLDVFNSPRAAHIQAQVSEYCDFLDVFNR